MSVCEVLPKQGMFLRPGEPGMLYQWQGAIIHYASQLIVTIILNYHSEVCMGICINYARSKVA